MIPATLDKIHGTMSVTSDKNIRDREHTMVSASTLTRHIHILNLRFSIDTFLGDDLLRCYLY